MEKLLHFIIWKAVILCAAIFVLMIPLRESAYSRTALLIQILTILIALSLSFAGIIISIIFERGERNDLPKMP